MNSIQDYLIPTTFSIKETLKRMDLLLANTVFVEDNDQLVGSVSNGDIRRTLLKEVSLKTPVSKIMNGSPIYVEEDCDESAIKEIFMEKKISAIPMLNQKGKVVKIIFKDDLFEGGHEIYNKIDLPVVIMTGGKGTRLDPFTRILPKALIPIDDKPVIDIIMNEYAKYGMYNFILSLNHKSAMIKAYFQECENAYKIDFIQETHPLGTAGALRLLRNRISSPFFVSNCDIIVKADYTGLYQFHADGGFALTIIASMQHYTIPYGICELDEGGTLEAISEKPEYDFLVNTGMYILNPETIDLIPEDKMFHMTDLINSLKRNNYKIGVYPVSEKSWIDIGQWGKYKESADRLNHALKDLT
ncbi:MAG: sugar phosphate nucleotidyltransferase [Deltaproteobacteria bacterium]|nr:sugar phosphate nucleotidyltransferase [Deltaproteobacteria bacterium]